MTKYRGIRVSHDMTLAERLAFYSTPDPATGCVLWRGAVVSKAFPYGRMRWKGKAHLAHVLAWQEANDATVPTGMMVRHICDTPRCINPAHLLIGTHKDNMADKVARNRQSRLQGEAHGMAKLTSSQVRAIRRDTRGKRIIAAEYGVTATLVRLIRQGKAWAHLRE